MKRDYSFVASAVVGALKWLISFLLSVTLMIVILVGLTLAHKHLYFEERVLRLVIMIVLSLCSWLCAFIFGRLSKIKGYISGIIAALTFSVPKIIMSFCTGGVGKGNFLVYIAIACSALIGGIMSAKRKKNKLW